MAPQSPRARGWLMLALLALLAAWVTARVLWSRHAAQRWQPLDAFAVTALGLFALRAVHGAALLRSLRRQTWGVLVGGNLLFSSYWYTGRVPAYRRWIAPRIGRHTRHAALAPMLYLGAGSLLYRALLPFAAARVLWRLRPGELGARASRNPAKPACRPLWPIYLALYLLLLPLLLLAARTAPFRRRYPFYRGVVGADGGIALTTFALAQTIYLAIFASGEAFWRGFWVFGCERDLGLYALPLMTIPYVTAHYGKPLAEALGAIAAGTSLGWLALKHRSFWLGVALHYAVALTMDLLAIEANGFSLRAALG